MVLESIDGIILGTISKTYIDTTMDSRIGRPCACIRFLFITFVGGASWKKAFSRGESSCGVLIDKGYLTSSACMKEFFVHK